MREVVVSVPIQNVVTPDIFDTSGKMEWFLPTHEEEEFTLMLGITFFLLFICSYKFLFFC